MSEQTPEATPADETTTPEPTFTQADLDRIVRERVKREREKFADYDELKVRAETAKTAEERLADLERKLAEADAREQRARMVQAVATAHGITDPEDIALFLTGQDEDTLTAQAKRLAARDGARRKAADIVPGASKTPTNTSGDPELREFARRVFERTPSA